MFGIAPYVACLRAGSVNLVSYCIQVLRAPTTRFPYYELKKGIWSFDGLKYIENNKKNKKICKNFLKNFTINIGNFF